MPVKKSNKKGGKKTIAILRHNDKRRNLPTAEFQEVMQQEEKAPIQIAYERRNRDLDPQLVWRGKDEQDWSDLVVQAPPLYIQEKVHPKVLIDDLQRESTQRAISEGIQTPDLFADFNGLPGDARATEFYQHDANWSNRMILGDSLQVMASLAEREGLRGKVQCIYVDPPYGIKFNSNFQWSTTTRDVKDGKVDHITREPEVVRAFRDTWRDGVHSYLTYLRDRLNVARDLLTDSGSDRLRTKHRPLYAQRSDVAEGRYDQIRLADGSVRPATVEEKTQPTSRPEGSRLYQLDNITNQRPIGDGDVKAFEFKGKPYTPTVGKFKTDLKGLRALSEAGRIQETSGGTLRYVRFADDFGMGAVTNLWNDISGAVQSRTDPKVYVVQSSTGLVERCILMATDPGDLVLDPTCGSGTTATVAEQWGRRWITIDTSRVALALARARIMGGRYPFYLLADSREGQLKEAEITRTALSSQPVQGNIRHGFVYERVPHITLKSIANNTEIDVIYDKWQAVLEPLRQQLNVALKKNWQEWEVPRDAEDKWSEKAKKLHADWWEARISRQKEADHSIKAKAEFEFLYDKPYEDKSKVRVAGPFTVESVSPHRVLAVDEKDNVIDDWRISEGKPDRATPAQDFASVILANLKAAGVQQAHKADKINFTSLVPWPGKYICAEGRYLEGEGENAPQKRAGIFMGPEFGTVSRPDLVAAAREAADAGFDVLIACAFNYDAHSAEFEKLGKIPVLKARMNPDLHMAGELKETASANLFVIFGEPDIEIAKLKDDELQVRVKGVDVFKPQTGEVVSDGPDGIACWFIDTNYNEESFFVRHAYFLGANDPYKSLKTTLRAEIDEAAWESLHSDTSRPFPKPETGRIAVKVINHLGDEVMKVFKI
jgi:adenine-specific DNA-methyltransferase